MGKEEEEDEEDQSAEALSPPPPPPEIADVLAEDKLFATLDPTTRQVNLPSGKKVLVTDTVGFIRKLPTQLIAAFNATEPPYE